MSATTSTLPPVSITSAPRTYQPTIARWTSVDPLFYMLAKAGMLGFGVVDPSLLPSLVDIYTYARNNSLSYVDPSGLFSDHHATWYHHWFPKDLLSRLPALCAPHGIIIDDHWSDQFTTPFTPGGMVNGMTHGWIHNVLTIENGLRLLIVRH